MKTVTYPSYTDHSDPTATYTYNSSGDMTSVEDWLGHETHVSSDADHNPTSIAYPNSTTASVAYNLTDSVTSISLAPTDDSSAPLATTPIGFAGGYTDSATGLIYLINRYYDPETGQFLSVDPDLATTTEAYVYANDDPVNGADPLGLCTWWTLCISTAVHAVTHAVDDFAHAIYTAARVVIYASDVVRHDTAHALDVARHFVAAHKVLIAQTALFVALAVATDGVGDAALAAADVGTDTAFDTVADVAESTAEDTAEDASAATQTSSARFVVDSEGTVTDLVGEDADAISIGCGSLRGTADLGVSLR